MYKIELKKSVFKDIRDIPQVFLKKIEEAIQKLSENPFSPESKKIQGYTDYYRIRVGMYRIIYRVEKKIEIVTIIKVGHRKEIYRNF